MSRNASKLPFVLTVVVTSVLLVLCLTVTIVFASLTVNQSKNVSSIGKLGTLSATVTSNTITVSNDMDCVMRASPRTSGVTFNTSQWILQDNGWYYYYKVIKQNDTTKAITVTGATASNLNVELAQAQYVLDTTTSSGKKAGFIVEWASRDIDGSYNLLGQYTSDGLAITTGSMENAPILMYSGHNANRRVPPASISNPNTFQATKQSDNSYTLNKVKLSSTATTYETITSSNAISLYNNTDVTVVYTIQIINGGHEPSKASKFSNGNWTTYVVLDSAPGQYVLASESTATSGYSTYFVSKPVLSGEYVELSNGSNSQLYFGDLTDNTTNIHLSISSMDTMTFYNNYLGEPEQDKYLAWLKSLDTNYSGKTYFNDFKKLITQSD